MTVGQPDSSASGAADYEGRLQEVRAGVLNAAEASAASAEPLASLATPDARMAEAKAKKAEQANSLRRGYGWALLGLLFVQVVGADVIFLLYAVKGEHWNIPAATMNLWLGATVVQVIGVVLVVVHYLFPREDGGG